MNVFRLASFGIEMLLLRNDLNSLPNYLGFLTGMSKFFKWLKKDKQEEESPVDKKSPLLTSDEQVNSELELIKNDNSIISESSATPNPKAQPETTKTTQDLEPKDYTRQASESVLATIEKKKTYKQSRTCRQ
jgi:fused signal recognition particle receptor